MLFCYALSHMLLHLSCLCRGVGARRGRVYCAVRLRGGERQPDGAAHHDQRLQDCLSREGDGCHTSLPILQVYILLLAQFISVLWIRNDLFRIQL